MPFQKGNKLGAMTAGRPKAKTVAWENILGWLVGDGGHQYKKLLAKQASGELLNSSEREFMDRFQDLLEFHQPKLARTEVTGKDGSEFKGVTVYLPKSE